MELTKPESVLLCKLYRHPMTVSQICRRFHIAPEDFMLSPLGDMVMNTGLINCVQVRYADPVQDSMVFITRKGVLWVEEHRRLLHSTRLREIRAWLTLICSLAAVLISVIGLLLSQAPTQ